MNKLKLKYFFSTLLIITFLSAATTALAAENTDYIALAQNGTLEEIQAAFKSKSNIKNAVYGSNRETFLMLVLQNDRDLDIVEATIKGGCSATATAKDKRTPLMYAAQYSSKEPVLKYMVEIGAKSQSSKATKIKAKDKSGKDVMYFSRLNTKIDAYTILSKYLSAKELSASDASYEKLSKSEGNVQKNAESSSGMVTYTFTGTFEDETETPVIEESKKIETPEPQPVVSPKKEDTTEKPVEKEAVIQEEVAKAEEKEVLPDEKIEIPAPVKTPRITIDQEPKEEKPISIAEEKEEPKTEPVKQSTQKVSPAPQTAEIKTYNQVNLFDYALNKNEVPEQQKKQQEVYFLDPNEADDFGVTLLMKAAKAGNDWDVQNLIDAGADLNLRDKDGWSALMYAVRYQNNLSLVQKLIDNGAHIRVRNVYNATPLLLAADYSQNPEIIKLLLKNRSAAENEVYNAFVLCLTSSSGSEHIKKAKIKLFLDMDISLNRIWKGKTPLMYACQYSDSTAVIGLLLEKGAKTNITDKDGYTAFEYAKQNTKLVHDDIYWSLNAK